jgi:hypothetical protein
VQIQIYDYILEKRPIDFIEKSIALAGHPGSGFLFARVASSRLVKLS